MSKILYLDDNEDNAVDEVIKSILEINEYDKHSSPIKLYINSSGGDVYPFLGLIDVIITSKTPHSHVHSHLTVPFLEVVPCWITVNLPYLFPFSFFIGFIILFYLPINMAET